METTFIHIISNIYIRHFPEHEIINYEVMELFREYQYLLKYVSIELISCDSLGFMHVIHNNVLKRVKISNLYDILPTGTFDKCIRMSKIEKILK